MRGAYGSPNPPFAEPRSPRCPSGESAGILAGVRGSGLLVALVLTAAACASTGPEIVEQRTTQGPKAEELWVLRVAAANGREPTFEERAHWERDLDFAISRYLAKDQEYANSLQVLTFRALRQVAVGMSKEQVTILLGPPQEAATDASQIEKLAGKFGPDVKGKVTETWVYPMGWRFHFAGDRLVDITQYLPR